MFNAGKRVAGAKLRGNWRLVTTNAENVSLKNLTPRNLAAGAKRGKRCRWWCETHVIGIARGQDAK